jgi:salicylate biosynthesis isochorismate synthase
MPARTRRAPGPFALSQPARARLAERIGDAVRTARRERRQVLATVTERLPARLDLSAAVLAARRGDDRFFCLEQPERSQSCLAGLGEAAVVEARGSRRFADVVAGCRRIAAGALCDDPADDPEAPPGTGPVWLGGFAFADDGGAAPEWASLAPAQLVVPELALARAGGEARMTLSAVLEGDEAPEAVLERLERRLDSLLPAPMPLADPDPIVAARVFGAAPPEHYEQAVRSAVERIAAGELRKVVLAREVRVLGPRAFEPGAVLDGLRARFPGCFCYCVGTSELAFVGASPELLVRRDGPRASTVALAGTAARSVDPALDTYLGEQLRRSAKNREEQAIVAARIERALEPVSLWVSRPAEPVLVKVSNVQHLATPVRAQLAEPMSVLELGGLLHPTPAVGGEPAERAAPLIPALEGLDRGWYAGPLGWMDLAEDGELCVALRCALLRGSVAHLYAGGGIVADSVPVEELAETEVKLQALMPLLR